MVDKHCGLKVRIKQGEVLNKIFTIKQGDLPLDLSPYKVRVQVKNSPNIKGKSIIDKIITQTSDINKEGQITNPGGGEFILHITEEDSSFPIQDYYLVISIMEDDVYNNIISSSDCSTAMFSICEQ